MYSLLPERDYITFGSLLSPIRLSSVGAPYSEGLTFRQYFSSAVYLGHPLTSVQNFTEIVPGNPSIGSVKRKKGNKIQPSMKRALSGSSDQV